MSRRRTVLLTVPALLLSACTSLQWWSVGEPSIPPAPASGESLPSASTVSITELAVGARSRSPSVPATDVGALVRGNTDFALDLFRRLTGASGDNLSIGPYSISSAIALINAGAAGRTQDQIETALHFGLPFSRLDRAFDALSIELESRQRPALTLATTNRLFGQQGSPFLDSYLREITGNFGAPIAVADYRRDWEADRQLINAWAAGKTNGRIRNLLPDGSINPDTRFVLVNAMYLNARWLQQFPESATRSLPFHPVGDTTIDVPTMSRRAMTRIRLTNEYQAVDLPYVGGQLSMLLVMPADLSAFEPSITSGVLSGIAGSLTARDVWVQLPRFSTRTSLSLESVLTAMGVSDAFGGSADFSGMLDSGSLAAIAPPEHPSIDEAFHQAFVRVSESGTESAASTALVGGTRSPPRTPTLKFDRPFVWFIRDRETHTILFMGRVVDPSEASS